MRRAKQTRNGTLLILGLMTIVGLLAAIPYLIAADDAQRPPTEQVVTRLELPPGVTIDQLEVGRVEDVVDGDTADVIINGRTYRVRYYGINTPEKGQKCFREATDRNQQLVDIGDKIYLLADAREYDPNNRLLRYVFLADGTSVDATLVAEGFAEAWRQDGQYREEIGALQAQAEASSRGCLWHSES